MAAISKQEYLKRYLSNSEAGKKKKKKKIPKSASKRPTSMIVDDDITLEDIKVDDAAKELNEFEVDADEAPAVYEDDGVTKISLETYKKREEDQRTKWAPISQNMQASPVTKAEHKSDYDSDNSPPRITNRRRQDSPDLSPQRGGLCNSPDQSPPRKRQDRSPPRRSAKGFSLSCAERRETDNSPPRSRRRHDSGDSIPEQVDNRLHSPDRSTARITRNDSPDLSSPQSGSNRDSTIRRVRNDSPDLSPHRSGSNRDSTLSRVQNDSPDLSPPRSKMNRESDQSPPRKRTNSNSDQSPPRKRTNSDSDQSPPRKQNRPERGSTKSESVRSGSEDRLARGRKAGLLSASDLKIENERRRAQEAEVFSKMDPTVSGKGSETVYRDKMGRIKDTKIEKLKRREEEHKEMEEKEKFMEWGRGVTQTKQTQEKVADYLHEVDKPLARYRDDKDLDSMLKDQERDDDPMLAYMKQQKKKQNIKAGKKEKPVYKGRDPPPNRFNIRPGYRWDGVDRSNGFERKRFTMLANKMATQSQAYKWSSEDM